MKMITTLTGRANLAAVDVQARLDSLTSEPEFGGARNVDEASHVGIGITVAAVVGLAVAGFVAAKMALLH